MGGKDLSLEEYGELKALVEELANELSELIRGSSQVPLWSDDVNT